MIPKVSIVIPAYNSEKFIHETLESALAQTWTNTEIIVVNDGSTDSTGECVAAFRHLGVKLVHQNRNGAAAARNSGFKSSTGDFIQYLDADDLLSPTKIETQLADILQAHPSSIASCGWGRFAQAPEEAEFISQKVWKSMLPMDWLVEAWEGGGMMQTACWLIPRHLIERSQGWNEQLTLNPNDDGEFFCRVLLKSHSILFNSSAKVYYRSKISGSLSQQLSDSAVGSLLATYDSHMHHALEKEDSPRIRRACAMNYLNFIYRFHPSYVSLIEQAKSRINDLGVLDIDAVGGYRFQRLAKLTGFYNALKIRSLVRYLNK